MTDEIEEICTVFDKFQKQEISTEDARKQLLSLVRKWKRKRKNILERRSKTNDDSRNCQS